MKKHLKVTAMLTALLMAISIIAVGCSQKAQEPAKTEEVPKQEVAKEQKGEEFPTKPINVIVSYAAGGGTDIGARVLLPFVEKELGVPVNVINKPGGNGWVGWAELAKSKPDGYTLGYINTPTIIAGYLNPKSNRSETIDSFDLITNHVTDYSVIAVKKDDKRFQTIEELMKYAQENELTAASAGAASDDHIAMLKINDKAKTKFVPVQMAGGKETFAAILGGHVDVYFGNVGEIIAAHKNGEVKVVAVLAPERVPFIPDVPTLEEAGYKGIYGSSARGIAVPKGMDPAILKKVSDAFAKAMQNEEHIKKMEELGLKVEAVSGEKYKAQVKQEEGDIKNLSSLLGW